jgi:hypothetical protein
MRFYPRMPKATRSFPSLPALLLVAGLTGCDNANDPAVKEQVQAQQDVIKKGEEEANAQLKKTGGKNAPTLRLSKPGLKGGPAPTQ